MYVCMGRYFGVYAASRELQYIHGCFVSQFTQLSRQVGIIDGSRYIHFYVCMYVCMYV